MQANHDAGDGSTRDGEDEGALGVLESPGRLTVSNDGVGVGTLSEPVALPTQHDKDGMVWLQHKYKKLQWGMIPAQLILQGASPQMLMGGQFILLRGRHRPVYAQTPGMDDVTVVQVLENPNGLGIEETFLHVAG